MTKHSKITPALKVIGITRHTFLKWEEVLSLTLPREGESEIRLFPEETIQNLKALRELLDALEVGLGEWVSWEQTLYLNHPRDAQGAPDFQDPYWATYYRKLGKDLAAGTVDVHELDRWEAELVVTYPRDSRGNIALTRDWCRYLQTVQEAYTQGRNTYWCAMNIPSPASLRPQMAGAALGPEY